MLSRFPARHRARVLGAVLGTAGLLTAAACAGGGPTLEHVAPNATGSSNLASGDSVAPDVAGAPPHVVDIVPTTSTAPPWAATTTAPLAVPPTATPTVCQADSDGSVNGAPPAGADAARASLASAIGDRRFSSTNLAVSVWVDGWGEIASVNAFRTFPPASNEKLWTAAGIYERLDVAEKPHTTVVATGPTVDGVVQGDLVLVGGGDPTLTRTGPRSLEALAGQLAAKHINEVDGRVLIDESRYDSERSIASWGAGWPSTVGVLSALVVDRNKNADPADPTTAIGGWFVDSLKAAGVMVTGGADHGVSEGGEQLAVVDGPTYGELVTTMLQNSDNLVAELLVKEIGRRHTGAGTTAAGLASIRDAVAVLCVPPGGAEVDGSGFSPNDARSAHQLRRLLQLSTTRQWGPKLKGSLPVAGQSGTLVGRLNGPRTAGNVRAKTGSLGISTTLSGYVTTAGGRQAYFSVIVSGNGASGMEPAIDNIASAIAALPN